MARERNRTDRKYKLENYNISNTYAQLANYYTMHHQPELALEALGKAVKTANSASHKILAKLTYVEYYSEFGDFPAAEKILKECRELFDQDKRLDSLKKGLPHRGFLLPAQQTVRQSIGSCRKAES